MINQSLREKMYRIETDTFILEFSPEIHLQDFAYPVNVTLGVKVSSYGYSAETFMDVRVQDIAEFAVQLNNLYETLEGEAKLEEPYSVHNYIVFIAEPNGHIKVIGQLNNKNVFGYTQEINFENEIDQTFLRSFIDQLFTDFRKYNE